MDDGVATEHCTSYHRITTHILLELMYTNTVETIPSTTRAVVKHSDVVSCLDKLSDQSTPDEARSTRDEIPLHGFTFLDEPNARYSTSVSRPPSEC